MKNIVNQVDVCVATYKRPDLLLSLLDSLVKQELGLNLTMRVIVVDNDSEESSKDTVNILKKEYPFPLFYFSEPRQGISYARNKALDNASAEYIAFLDDDEVAEPNWLKSLFDTLLTTNSDVVFGPVIGVLPEYAPDWTRSHASFQRPRLKTGAVVKYGASGNVIFKASILVSPHQAFDHDFGLTGGGDTEFFYRLHLAGKKLIWCDEAMVKEDVPDNRLTLQWVFKRSFRGGQGYYRVFVTRFSLTEKCIWFIKKLAYLLGGLILLPIVKLIKPKSYINLKCLVFGFKGQLSALFGKRFYYQEYTDVQYTNDTSAKR